MMLRRFSGAAIAAIGAITIAVLPGTPALADTATRWTAQTSNTTAGFDSVSFVDCNNGWAAGDETPVDPNASTLVYRATIVRTSDGGNTWSRQSTPVDAHIDRIVFVDKLNGWAAGNDRNGGVILHTADGGANWVRDTAIDAFAPLKFDGMWFTDKLHGFAGETNDANTGSRVFQTTDGGATWSLAFTASNSDPLDLEGMHAIDPTHVWLVGEASMVRLKDGTWSEESSGSAAAADATLSSVFFVSATRGWAVGHKDTVLFTDDGGTTWTSQRSTSNDSGPLNLDVRFYDREHGFFVGDSGRIFASADHGTTWTQETTPTTAEFEGLSAPNSGRAWAVGSNGTILTRLGTPSVTNVSPSSGPEAGGNTVTISGCGFTGATGVNIGSSGATFTVNSDSQITATVPPGSGGQPVTVTSPMGTSAVSAATTYTYIAPAVPVVAPKLPKAGYGGATVPPAASYLFLFLAVPVLIRVARGAPGRRR